MFKGAMRNERFMKALQKGPLNDATLELLLAIIESSGPGHKPATAQWTVRDEANALTALAFRNGFLEDLHSEHYQTHRDPSVRRITGEEIKKLMLESSAVLAGLLRLRTENPDKYMQTVAWASESYCEQWERHAVIDSEAERVANPGNLRPP
jgi:hypothetical protein